MKPYLDVPFLSDQSYVEYLEKRADEIDSLHFALFNHDRLDNRILLHNLGDDKPAVEQLARLHGPRKYALLNSRFYPQSLFTDKERTRMVLKALEICLDHNVLHGIIYCDHYLLQRFAEVSPELAAELEAVPSVNTMLDSFAKIDAHLSYISDTGFKPPEKIVLDRSLNRDLDLLAEISLRIRAKFPNIHIEVLANEGCLWYCPFKLSHDAYIALANASGETPLDTFNCRLGCVKIYQESPHHLFFSPFIRPEDIDLYLYHVDTIKLCGRTLGSDFLKNVIEAYRHRQYQGNLLDLLDAVNWLADKLHIDNSLLSFDFAGTLSMCDHRCDICGFCMELFQTVAYWKSLSIPGYKAVAD
ncbi:MAG: hypothetical protein CSA31_01470 [Desulfobulbus propionicus]|nr:MAG: hypothetical protein CSA31_01470 [Desulfobulbus propionicus]